MKLLVLNESNTLHSLPTLGSVSSPGVGAANESGVKVRRNVKAEGSLESKVILFLCIKYLTLDVCEGSE